MVQGTAVNASGKKIGLALGGLGGSNAHGVGVLQAMRTLGLRPQVLSCTSGMIEWAARWLKGDDLRMELEASIKAARAFPPTMPVANWLKIVTQGLPGVFRPALQEYWQRWAQPFDPRDTKAWADRVAPAQTWVPLRTDAAFADIADTFNRAEDIAIFFNSFDPDDGYEIVHANPAGWAYLRTLWQARGLSGEGQEGVRVEPERAGPHGPRVVYESITAESVRDALWLNAYGFGPSEAPRQRIDGAYVRQFILSEMVDADILFIARPQAYAWLGRAPQNYTEIQDFQTELWFNAAYGQQIHSIEMVNAWIKDGKLKDNGYNQVRLEPIEIAVQRSYFEYFVEDIAVYDHAYDTARKHIEKVLNDEI